MLSRIDIGLQYLNDIRGSRKKLAEDRTFLNGVVYSLCFYLILESSYHNKLYHEALSFLGEMASSFEYSRLNGFIGDMQSLFFSGGSLYYHLERRLRFYLQAVCIPKVVHILSIIAKQSYMALQIDIYESQVVDILGLMSQSSDALHPQFIAFLTEYYFMGGKAKIEEALPMIDQILPHIDKIPADDDTLLTLDKGPPESDFLLAYILGTKVLDKTQLTRIVYFRSLTLQRELYITCFEVMFFSKSELVKRLAVKCLQLPTLNRDIPNHRLAFRKGQENIQKFEACHRGLLELLDAYSTADNQVSSDANTYFSIETRHMEDIDYTQSFVLLLIFKTISKTGFSDSCTTALLSAILNQATRELHAAVGGQKPLSVQTIYALHHVATILKLMTFKDDLESMAFYIRTPRNYLEQLMLAKLFKSILAGKGFESVKEIVFNKLTNKLVFIEDQVRPAREALKQGWVIFSTICSELTSKLAQSEILSRFDELSVFHSMTHCRTLSSRWVFTPSGNTFLRDILTQPDNPLQDFIQKLLHIFFEQKGQAVGLNDKTTLSYLQHSVNRSLRKLVLSRVCP